MLYRVLAPHVLPSTDVGIPPRRPPSFTDVATRFVVVVVVVCSNSSAPSFPEASGRAEYLHTPSPSEAEFVIRVTPNHVGGGHP